MKRIAFLVSAFLLLTACAPSITVENFVLPTLYSVQAPETPGAGIVLQGRYFGDGQEGAAEASYVILGADVNGQGGVAVRGSTWTPSRIVVGVPEGAGSGFAFVVVDGVRSNGLPISLP